MEDQEQFDAMRRFNSSASAERELEWTAACSLREEEALVLLADERLFPLAGKVMLTALDPDMKIPDEAPDERERQALILWGMKRQFIRTLFGDLQAEMEPTVRAVSNGTSFSLGWMIERLCQNQLTYATFSAERLRLLESYETALAAVKANLSEHDPRRDRHLSRPILL